MTYVIYILKNKINDKVYIGQTCQPLDVRWKNGRGYSQSIYLNHAIQCYGAENFYYEILREGLSKKEADKLEIFYINHFDSRNPEKGFNIAVGGAAPMQGRKHSPKTIEKMKQSHIGINTWMEGRTNHHSEERKQELSKFMKENKLWLLASINIEPLQKWIAEHHTKIRRDQYDTVINEYNNGLSTKQLSIKYNVHMSVIQKILKGKVQKRLWKKINPSDRLKIIEMYNNGSKSVDLALLYNVDVCTIHRIIKKSKNE